MSNNFGGSWTLQKVQIIEDYARAYLQIMKGYPQWKLMYFDGFAGTGEYSVRGTQGAGTYDGAAKKIVSIRDPKPFDMCYFVELDKQKAQILKETIQPIRTEGIHITQKDCNEKILDLACFLRGGKGLDGLSYKVLAFIDPYGMNVKWSSIEALKGLGVDMWILAPTGIGANRLLTRDGNIPDSWSSKLEDFFGVPADLIYQSIYTETVSTNFFGASVTTVTKHRKTLQKIDKLYSARLLTVFNYVSNPYVMRNRTNSTMYHLYLASNNTTAVKIANDIVRKSNLKTH